MKKGNCHIYYYAYDVSDVICKRRTNICRNTN